MKLKRTELKKLARSLMLGKYNVWLFPLILYFLADLAASFLPMLLFGSAEDTFSTIAFYAASFIFSTFFGMLGIGLIRIAGCICRNQPFTIRDFIYAFKNSTDAFIRIELLFAAVRSLLALLTLIVDWFALTYDMGYVEYVIAFYAVTVFVYFLVMLVTIRLIWSVYYIIDDPRLSARQALKMSLAVTKGKALKLIILKISFAGMYALSIASFLTGFLYVSPYMETTYMLCFLELSGQALPAAVNEEPEVPKNPGPSYWPGAR